MTLRKMYLVTPELYARPTKKRKKMTDAINFDKWVTVREQMEEREFKQKMELQKVAEYLRKLLPDDMSRSLFVKQALASTQTDLDAPPEQIVKSEPLPSTSYETPKQSHDDGYSAKDVGKVASPFLLEQNKNRLDRVYGIRRKGNVLMIGDSEMTVDENSNIHIKGVSFEGTKGLWRLLTLKSVLPSSATKQDMDAYKDILLLTNAHLEQYERGNSVNIHGGTKYNTIIAPLFRSESGRKLRKWVKY